MRQLVQLPYLCSYFTIPSHSPTVTPLWVFPLFLPRQLRHCCCLPHFSFPRQCGLLHSSTFPSPASASCFTFSSPTVTVASYFLPIAQQLRHWCRLLHYSFSFPDSYVTAVGCFTFPSPTVTPLLCITSLFLPRQLALLLFLWAAFTEPKMSIITAVVEYSSKQKKKSKKNDFLFQTHFFL